MSGGLLVPKRFFNFAQTVKFSCEINVPYLGLSNMTSISGNNFKFEHYFNMVADDFFS